MEYKDIAFLASNTARTKAYIQILVKNDCLPSLFIVYSDDIDGMEHEADQYVQESRTVQEEKYFSLSEPVIWTIRKMQVPYITVKSKDINSDIMRESIKSIEQKYLVYSGYGGFILKKPLFELGKKYIHVHAGVLPQYRGSTTFYYSWLQENSVGASAIFLSPGIDEGEIIVYCSFPVPTDDVDVDYIYEPYIRARVLLEVFKMYDKGQTIHSTAQEQTDAETYFIIHPVLKHIALLEREEQIGQKNAAK